MALQPKQYVPNSVVIYLGKESNGNVTLTHYEDHTTFEDVYSLKCKVCDKITDLKVDPWEGDTMWSGQGLKWLADFTFDHKHEKVTFIKKPGQFIETDQEVVKIKPGQVVNINGKSFDVVADLAEPKPVEEPQSGIVPMMGAFDFHPGGRAINTVAISQDLLKEVARLSNFNVDLQAKVAGNIATQYRAICSRCGKDCEISYEELISKDRKNKTWIIMKEFCSVHSHSPVVESSEGRKFRDAN